jgi:hypothetical protein
MRSTYAMGWTVLPIDEANPKMNSSEESLCCSEHCTLHSYSLMKRSQTLTPLISHFESDLFHRMSENPQEFWFVNGDKRINLPFTS